MFWDPNPILFTIPGLRFPILWYGFFFALGFWLATLFLARLLSSFLPHRKGSVRKLIDHLSLHIVIATVLGARLGHLLFYESPPQYLLDPIEIFRIRSGGLASHGAVLAILLAIFLFSKRMRREEPLLTPLRLLDLLAIVAPLTGAFIRMGNFMNQEILGSFTSLPWGVTFGHPADGSLPIPRHPVQLYEALSYLLLFFVMRIFVRRGSFPQEGFLSGLLLTLLFSLRFLLEMCKVEQSAFFSSSFLTMGQLLSLPFIAVGLGLLLRTKRKRLQHVEDGNE